MAEPMQVQENLRTAEKWVRAAVAESGAELVVLPESCTTGFTPLGSAQDLWNVVAPLPGALTEEPLRWARELGIYIVFPTYERGEKPGVVYNSAAVIGPEGILGIYRKTHPFPTERLRDGEGWTTPGSEPLCVDTPLGKIGVVICYDGDFPELARVTALQGAEIICRPSAFMRTFDHWELTNRARAYDNHVYWIATNSVGRDASGSYFFGGSMIVHPTGQKIAQARAGDEYIWAKLDPDPLRKVLPGTCSEQWFDHVEDRNLSSYAGLLEEGRCPFEPAKRIPYRR
jgi:predicted amidohydrolase